ncbi:AimR family lysis-lysogeny pheromone receptor [Fictibacillus terranigra]|uniref:AimR family lysis-lysogeny pheromone receptor n=1 Tax=Fictibacillus terranigra TaxID=3058424 RepID=A0ABT8E6T9_9BACL|nr:AimR family lysis-lysogeny pheromone receptor [Fictibacillus sp. CENA-BCM004]MDN4073634.1 AimR family lysis-lysogeny pheromone receptor [Fictibacillus sp. CENA-BCM004]
MKKAKDMRSQLQNEIIVQNLKLVNLSNHMSNDHGLLSKFLLGHSEIAFFRAVKLTKYLFPNNYREKIWEWRDEFITPLQQRQALEYASISYDLRLMRYMLHKQKNHENNLNCKYGQIYEIVYSIMTGELKGRDIAEAVRNRKFRDENLLVLVRILEAYSAFYEGRYTLMFDVAKTLEKQVHALSDQFFRDCFMVRLSEMFSHGFLQQNNVRKARYYATVVTQFPYATKLASNAHYVLGMSFLFEDGAKCIEHLETYRDMLIEAGAGEHLLAYAVENIEFAKVTLGHDIKPVSVEEIAHVAALKGDLETTKQLLATVDPSPFCTYLIGLASDDVDVLWTAMGEYLEQGDVYFSQLPKQRLEALGERQSALSAVTKLRCS